ncbi:MAG: Uma2 family endonuclease [Acidobacteriia bacterium]|nr:Uma2 family endonuclease [Terriglobia bacterium]
MASASVPYLTPEQYLEIERQAEFRSEYLHGEMFAMAGTSFNHNRIVRSTERALGRALDGRRCDVFFLDVKVHVPATGLYTYPDIVVTCGPIAALDKHQDTLTNPLVIVEVLSPSTRNYDRGEKFQHYRSIPSFREYLVLAQDEIRVEHHVRQPDGAWIFREHTALTDVVHLASIDCNLNISTLYADVEFPTA